MQTLKIDENNNLIISQNSLKVIENLDACVQDTKTRIGLCAGEDVWNTNKGINFFDEVLGIYTSQSDIKNQIKKRILDNEEIYSIKKLDLRRNIDGKNNIQLTAEINSIYGVLEL